MLCWPYGSRKMEKRKEGLPHHLTLSIPVVMYGCESWTIKKAEGRRIDAFELWCWRRLLRVPWTARRSNRSILKEISPEYSLEGLMLKLKLQYFGHLMWRTDSLARTLMLGKIECGRRRGWQRMRWLDASLTWWTWDWASSGSWWWTGRPGVLQSMGSQRVRLDWATELNWIVSLETNFHCSHILVQVVWEGAEKLRTWCWSPSIIKCSQSPVAFQTCGNKFSGSNFPTDSPLCRSDQPSMRRRQDSICHRALALWVHTMLTEQKIQNALGRLGTSLSLTSPLRSQFSVSHQTAAGCRPKHRSSTAGPEDADPACQLWGEQEKMLKTTDWTSCPRSEPPEFAQDISWVSRTLGQEECGCGLSLENTGPCRPSGILLC